jgi:soluble lytic murein transglycosylase-like protein
VPHDPAPFRAIAAAARHARPAALLALFAGGAAVGWARLDPGGVAAVVVPPEPVALTAESAPAGSDGLRAERADSSSGIWEAPAPPRRAARAVGSPIPAEPGTPAAEVDRWVARLALDQRAATRGALERMAAYRPLILHELDARGLPADLIHLALIESHFVTGATSSAGAVGIWQLMPATARAHGLEVSEWVDERRDPIRSTRAAVRHLEWLHRRFGSWHLALAAYNAGDARVGGILRDAGSRAAGDDLLYWRAQPLLPAETRAYVPKLLAASRIARAPERYGFERLEPRAPLRFREVQVQGGVDLAAVARAIGVDPEEVYALNPHLLRRATPPGRSWPVRVPPVTPRSPDTGVRLASSALLRGT